MIKINKGTKIFFAVMIPVWIGLGIMVHRSEQKKSAFISITKSSQVDMVVTRTFDDHAVLFMNDTLSLFVAELFKCSENDYYIEEPELTRQNIVRLSDFRTPFRLMKEPDKHYLLMIKNGDTTVFCWKPESRY